MSDPTLGSIDRKLDAVAQAIQHQDEKLWGKDGFVGDIPEILAAQKEIKDCVETLQTKAAENAANIKVLQETKLGWKDWKFIVILVAAITGSGGVGAGIAELLK